MSERYLKDQAEADALLKARQHPPRNSPIIDRQSSAWERELNKMIGREVTVTQYVGTSDQGLPLYIDHEGVCVALQFQHLSIVLMTDTEKIVLKNIHAIRRKRTKNNAPLDNPVADLVKASEQLADVLGTVMKGVSE